MNVRTHLNQFRIFTCTDVLETHCYHESKYLNLAYYAIII